MDLDGPHGGRRMRARGVSGTPVFVLAGLLAVPASAPAGQALGDDTGFVPPDRTTLAWETRVSMQAT
jgi:hypothetical protein